MFFCFQRLSYIIFVVALTSIDSPLFSWIFARKWPAVLKGPQLGRLCDFLSICAWMIVISPVAVLITWGYWLIWILGRDLIGLAIIMAGTALLLAFYSIMLWWRTQWQSSSMFPHFVLLSQIIPLIKLGLLVGLVFYSFNWLSAAFVSHSWFSGGLVP